MRLFAARIIATLFIGPFSLGGAQQSIGGTVVGDRGAIVTDAAITVAVRLPNDALRMVRGSVVPGSFPQHGPVVATIAAQADGTFTIPALAAGDYAVCARSISGNYLDTCIWSASLTGVQVSGAAIPPLRLVMTTGAELLVHVNDASGALAAVPGPPKDLAVSIGPSFGPSLQMAVIASSAVARDYRAVIPFDTTVNLCIASSSVSLGDESGKPFPQTGTVMPISAASGAAATAVRVTINVLGAR